MVVDSPDLLGEVREAKRTIIPGNSTLRVKCRVLFKTKICFVSTPLRTEYQ